MLWLIGGLLGLGVARAITSLFDGAQVGYTELSAVPLDARVLAFAAAIALAVGLLFAAFPAWSAQRADAAGSLKGAAASAGRHRLWAREEARPVLIAPARARSAFVSPSAPRRGAWSGSCCAASPSRPGQVSCSDWSEPWGSFVSSRVASTASRHSIQVSGQLPRR